MLKVQTFKMARMQTYDQCAFRWEADLCASFKDAAEPQLWSRHTTGDWFIFEESTCSDGRADQVWGRVEPGWNCHLLRSASELLLKPTVCRVLARLRGRKPVLETELKTVTGVSTSVLRKAIRQLLAANLIIAAAEKLYKLAKNVRFPDIEICAFEMKLKNWQRALYQSTRYKSFSHRVFVVMPSDTSVTAVQNRERFEKLGIGLMIHAKDGSTSVLVRASKKKPRSDYQSLLALGTLLSRGSLKAI